MDKGLRNILLSGAVLLFLSVPSYGQCPRPPKAFAGAYVDRTCQPVTVDIRDFSGLIPCNIIPGTVYTIDWDDGSPIETYVASANDQSLPPGTFVHTYDANDDSCVYRPVYRLSNQYGQDAIIFVVNVFDTEQDRIAIAENYELCVGDEQTFTFHDGTIFNCLIPPPYGNSHDSTRVITWKYYTSGSTLTMSPARGITITRGSDQYGDGVFDLITGFTDDSTHYKTPPVQPGTPQEGTPSASIYFPLNSTDSNDIGKTFEVTIDIWNDCNPFGSAPPVEARAVITVVSRPPLPAAPSYEYCQGDAIAPLTAAGTDIRWYADSLQTILLYHGAVFDTAINSNIPAVHTFWVTQRNLSGSAGCESYPRKVTVTIYPSLQPGVIGNNQGICEGETPAPLVETTAPAGGNGTYTYQWQVASNIAGPYSDIPGATGAGYAPPALMATTYYRRHVFSGPCDEYSAPVTITVTPALNAGSVGNDQFICKGDNPVIFTETLPPSGGTGVFTYQWEKAIDLASFAVVGGATSVVYDPPALDTTTFYRRRVQSGYCTAYTDTIKVDVTPTVYGGTVWGNSAICQGEDPPGFHSVTLASGGNGAYSYQWQIAPDLAGPWSNINLANDSVYDSPALNATRWFRRYVTSGQCSAFSNSLEVNVTPSLNPGSITPDQTICIFGDPSVINSLTAPTGGNGIGTYTYRWLYATASGGPYTNVIAGATDAFYDPPAGLNQTRFYVREVTSGSCTGITNEIRIAVQDSIQPGSIQPPAVSTLCSGDDPDPITQVTGPSGGTGVYSFQWKSSPNPGGPYVNTIVGATGSNYDPPAGLSATTYFVREVSSGVCPPRVTNEAPIFIQPVLNAGVIGSDQALCGAPATPAPLTEIAPASGGNGTYSYQWQSAPAFGGPWSDIGGATAPGYSPPGLLATTYYRRVVTGGVCPPAVTNVVTINITGTIPGNAGPITGPSPVCEGQTATYYISAVAGAASYAWTVPAGAVIIGRSDTAVITLRFDTPGTGNISVAPVNGCGVGGSSTKVIVINPTPIINPVADSAFCPGENYTFTFSSSNTVGATYTWTNSLPGPLPGGIDLPASGTGNISYTAPLNLTGSAKTGLITVTATLNGCTSAPVQFRITSRPKPVINPLAGVSACPAQQVIPPAFSSNTTGETYQWFNSNTAIGLAASGTGQIASYSAPANITGSPFIGNIKVVATLNRCVSDTAGFTITIKPTPVLSTPANISECPLATVGPVVFNSNVTGTTYSWSNNNTGIGLAANGTGNISSYTAPDNPTGLNITGTISVNGTADGCTSDPVSFTITIKPQPVVNQKADISVCPGVTVTPGAFSSNTGAGTTYKWFNSNTTIGLGASGTGTIAPFPAGNNVSGLPLTGTISVLGTKNGCESLDTMRFDITVKPKPVVDDQPDITACPGEIITPVAFNSNTAGTTYAWTNSNTLIGLPIGGTGNIAPFAAGNNVSGSIYTGQIVVTGTANGCAGDTVSFFINVKPKPVITPKSDISLCPGENINVGSFASNVPGSTFSWTNSNTLIGLPASGTGDIPVVPAAENLTLSSRTGTITVFAEKDGCISSAMTFTISVKPRPVVTQLDSIAKCPGEPVAPPNFTSSLAGSDFAWTNTNTLIGLPASGIGNIIPYAAPLNLSGSSYLGTIGVTATRNGCVSDTMKFNIRIKPRPVVSPLADISVCPNEQIGPINYSANTGGGELFSWTNDNTLTGLAPSGTGDIPAYFAPENINGVVYTSNLSVIATKENCSSTPVTFKVQLKPRPVVNFQPDIVKCPGETVSATFTSNVTGATFGWTNNNTDIGLPLTGSGNINPYAAPENVSGGYFVGNIKVGAVLNGCLSDSMAFNIFIKPTPVISPTPDYTVCPGELINLSAFTTNPPGASFTWSNTNPAIGIAVGGIGTIPPYLAPANATGTDISGRIIVQADLSGCSARPDTFFITVKPKPIVDDQPDIEVCPGEIISPLPFTSNTPGATFAWTNKIVSGDIGLPSGGTGDIASYTAPVNNTFGDFKSNIYVKASRLGCVSDSVPFAITVHPTPQTGDISGGTEECIDGNDLYSAAFHGNAEYIWERPSSVTVLSGGAPANNFIQLRFDSAGTVLIKVTERNVITGCVGATKSKTITVHPKPVIDTIFGKADVCNSETNVLYSVADHPGSTYQWDVPSGAYITTDPSLYNIRVNFSSLSGNIRVRETSAAGCVGDYKQLPVTVHPIPDVFTSLSTQAICNDDRTAFTVGTNYFDPSDVRFVVNVTASTDLSGYTPTDTVLNGALIADSLHNSKNSERTALYFVTPRSSYCAGSPANVTVTVRPTPVVIPSQTVKYQCNNATVGISLYTSTFPISAVSFDYTAESSGGVLGFTASAAGLTNGAVISDVLNNTTNTVQTVRYHVVPKAFGCVGDTVTITVFVKPSPDVLYNNFTPAICDGDTTRIVLSTSVVPADSISFDYTVLNTGGITGYMTFRNNLPNGYVISDVLNNATDVLHSLTYVVTPKFMGCTGTAENIVVQVAPRPKVNVSAAAQEICNLTAMNLKLTTTTTPTDSVRFDYTVSSTGGVTGYSDGTNLLNNHTINFILTNSTNLQQTLTFEITPRLQGCYGSPKTATVLVNPTPDITPVPAGQNICAGQQTSIELTSNTLPNNQVSFNYTATGTAGVSGFSNNVIGKTPGSFISDVLNNITTSRQTVTYVVRPFFRGCQGPADTILVNVDPKPTIAVNPSTITICDSTEAAFRVSTTTTPADSVTFIYYAVPVAGVSGYPAGVVTGVHHGDTIRHILKNSTNAPQTVRFVVRPFGLGCYGDSVIVDVTVLPEPVVNPSTFSQIICSNGITNINLQTPTAPTGSITFDYTAVNPDGGVTGFNNLVTGLINNSTIGENLKNSANNPRTVLYTITPKSGICVGKSKQVTVTVNPVPKVNPSVLAQNICDSTATNIVLRTPTSPVDSVRFSYTVMATGGVTGYTSPVTNLTDSAVIFQTLKNPTFFQQTVTYQITPSYNGCAGSPTDVVVTVNPTSDVVPSYTPAICDGTVTNILITTNANPKTLVTFNYTGSSADGVTGMSSQNGIPNNSTVSDILRNGFNDQRTATYTITPFIAGCQGKSQTITIAVKPTPNVSSSPLSQSICDGTKTAFTLTTSTLPTDSVRFRLEANSTGGVGGYPAAPLTGLLNNHTVQDLLSNATNAPQNVNYIITPSSQGCTGPSINVIVTVKPTPVVAPPVTSQTICSNTNAGITLLTPTFPADSVRFSYTASGSANVFGYHDSTGLKNNSQIADFLSNTGNNLETVVYTVTPEAQGCTGTAVPVTVRVNPVPVVQPSVLNQTICNNEHTSFLLTSPTNVTPLSFDYNVTSTGSVVGFTTPRTGLSNNTLVNDQLTNLTSGAQTVTYRIIPKAAGCVGSPVDVNVRVNPTPVLSPSVSSQTICSGALTGFTVSTTTVPNDSVTFGYIVQAPAALSGYSSPVLNLPAGSGINVPITNTSNAPQIAYFKMVPQVFGCKGDTSAVAVTVEPKPVLNVSATEQTICDKGVADILLTTPTLPTSAISFSYTATSTGSVSGFSSPRSGLINNDKINDNLFNFSDQQQTVTYRLVPGSSLCKGDTVTVRVHINPTPKVNLNPLNSTICDEQFSHIVLSTPTLPNASVTYTITATGTDSITGFTPLVSNAPFNYLISEQLYNTSDNQVQKVTYTITPWANGCQGTVQSATVQVNPMPVIDAGPDQVVCSDGLPFLSATAKGSYNSVTWSGGAGSFSNKNSLSTLYFPAPAESGSTFWLRIQTNDASGVCAPAKDSMQLTVRPKPVVSAGPGQVVCESTPVHLNGTASGTYTRVKWTTDNGTGTFTNDSSLVTTYLPPRGETGFITLRLTAYDDAAVCNSVSSAVTITINPLPVITVVSTLDGSEICAGEPATFTAYNALYYKFFVNGSVVQDSSLNNKYTGVLNTGDRVWVRGTSAAGCSNNSDTTLVHVNPLPVVTITSSDDNNIICKGEAVTFTAGGASNYRFYVNALPVQGPGPNNNYLTTGIADGQKVYVQGIDTNNCRAYSDTITMTVRDLPEARIITNDTSFCDNGINQVNMLVELKGTGPWRVGWTDDGGATIHFTDTITSSLYAIPVTARVGLNIVSLMSVMEYNGASCLGLVNPRSLTITVFENPRPSISTLTDTARAGVPLDINMDIFGGSGNYPLIVWTGDSNLVANPFVRRTTFKSNLAGDYTLYSKVTDNRGCTGYDTLVVHVVITPIVVHLFFDTAQTCAGVPIPLNGVYAGNIDVSGGTGNYIGYSWTGDIGYIDNPNIRFPNFVSNTPGAYHFVFTVTDDIGTKGIDSLLVLVHPNPVINFPSDTLFTCASDTTILSGHVTGGSGSYIKHEWTGDVGALSDFSVAEPSFRSSINTIFRISYKVTDSRYCSSTDSIVLVNEAPTSVFFSDANPFGACSPSKVNFRIVPVNTTHYSWNFGDGTPEVPSDGLALSHVFTNEETYYRYYRTRLNAYSQHGCVDSSTTIVTIFPVPDYDFIMSDDSVCSGETVSFTSIQGGAVYQWNFGEGNELANYYHQHQFLNNTLYDSTISVRLVVITSTMCSDTVYKPLVVHPVPEADFTASPALQVFPQTTVSLTNNKPVSHFNYDWNYGDGNVFTGISPGTHTYTTWGDYTIRLRAYTQYCESTANRPVKIIPPVPIAGYTTDKLEGCPPLTVRFTNTSTYASSYMWDFGDGGASSDENPVYTYTLPGTYTVTLIASGDGGKDTVKTYSITVFEPAVSWFSLSPVTVIAPDDFVNFTDLSTNAVSWLWEFGDGDTSRQQNPRHNYREEGVYDVTLSVISPDGCASTYTKYEAVTAKAEVIVKVPDAFSPNQFGPPHQPQSDAMINYNNDIFKPKLRGVDERYYTFQVFNRWGELLFETHDVRIGWDGYFKGQLCPQDVYVWKVKYRSLTGQGFEKMGDVTLYR